MQAACAKHYIIELENPYNASEAILQCHGLRSQTHIQLSSLNQKASQDGWFFDLGKGNFINSIVLFYYSHFF